MTRHSPTTPSPWAAGTIEWDDGNESELAAHGITYRDVRAIWESGPIFRANVRRRSGDWKMTGRTNAGRWLTIVFSYDPANSAIRPITGWSATKGERTRYAQER